VKDELKDEPRLLPFDGCDWHFLSPPAITMSKIFVLLLGVAAAELSFTGYTEGSSWHKAVVVSNDGCTDVQLNDYTISICT
jgi:hypothetical protein